MARIGWLSDSHIDPRKSTWGAGERLTEDITALFEEKDIDFLFFNGDAVSRADSFSADYYEHSTPKFYSRFWELVDQSGYGNRVAAVPGNHDTPLQYFLESDKRAHLRYKRTYDDGVTVLMVNTAGPGAVNGSVGSGYGWSVGYVPYKDLQWLDQQLAEAGDDTKVVYFHHHAWLTPGDPLASAETDTLTQDQGYFVCQNYNAIHDILSSYDKVVCPQGHTPQFQTEGSSRVDGVEYLYKKHYYDVFNHERVTTYGYLDVTSEGCTVKTVDHNSGEENTLLDKTF